MLVPRIHHVQVAMPAGREDEARRFYGDLLSFPEIAKPGTLAGRGGVWFQTGNLQLHLGVDPDFRPATKAHIAYEVDDIASVRTRLDEAGFAVTEDDLLPGFERLYVNDPFENRVEILRPGC